MDSQKISNFVVEVKQGIQESFTALLIEYRPYLIKQSQRYFAPGMDQEDLFQEASLGLYKAVCNYDETKGEFMPFSYMTIKSHLMNVIKAALRKKHTLLNDACSLEKPLYNESQVILYDVIASPTLTPERLLLLTEDKHEWIILYRLVLERCSKKEKIILHNFLKGISYNDISVHLGITEKSVDNALYRIRKKFKNNLSMLELLNIS